MHFLMYKHNALTQEDLINNLKNMGHSVDCIIYNFHDFMQDNFFANKFRKYIAGKSYDAVLSINYFPLISKLCEEASLLYFSWSYDSPAPRLVHMDNPFNRIFLFDKTEYLKYKKAGCSTVYHLPLAVDTGRLDTLTASPEQLKRFQKDISFVGKLYQNYKIKSFQKTNEERTRLLSGLSRRHSVTLYAPYTTDIQNFENLNLAGPVEYYHEMPLAFRHSKINLNITLSCIESGIPLRILDILGSGGFLITNPQSELEEYFSDGVDLVYYQDEKDLYEKVAYYLSHEEERKQIAMSGYEKVKQYFNYPLQIQRMFEMGGLI